MASRTPVNQQPASGVRVPTVRGGIDPGDNRFRPQFLGVVDVWKYFWSGDESLSSSGDIGSMNPRLGFLHRAGRYRSRVNNVRPQYIGVVDVSNNLLSGEGPLSSQVAAGSTNPRLAGWSFHTVRAVSTRGTTVFVLGLFNL